MSRQLTLINNKMVVPMRSRPRPHFFQIPSIKICESVINPSIILDSERSVQYTMMCVFYFLFILVSNQQISDRKKDLIGTFEVIKIKNLHLLKYSRYAF